MPRSVRSLHILVAEDNPVSRTVAATTLQKMGHTVQTAQNGKEAVSAVQEGSYDLVLMDVQMPEMDGLEATKAIREIEAATGGHIPIIAMTAHATTVDRERFLGSGMDHCLFKPVRSDELAAIIDRLMAVGHRPRTEDRSHAREDVFDLAHLSEKFRGDRALLSEIVAVFLGDYPTRLARIRDAAARGDAQALFKAAHTLRGSLLEIEAHGAAEMAAKLEQIGSKGNISSATMTLERLGAELDRLRQALIPICSQTSEND